MGDGFTDDGELFTLDALGNIPFLRSVHPYERSEMTSVFRTYMELSQLLPAAAFAVLLTAFPIRSVFLLLGAASSAGPHRHGRAG